MRGLLLLPLLPACVDAGTAVRWPERDLDLAFLIELDGARASVLTPAFRLRGGAPEGLEQAVVSGRATGQRLLLGLRREALQAGLWVVDDARLLEASLEPSSGGTCELSYAADRRWVTRSLPQDAELHALSPDGDSAAPADLDPVRTRFGLRLPVVERGCAPPFLARPFAPEGFVTADGLVLDGRPRAHGSEVDRPYHELLDAQYVSPDEALILTRPNLFLVRRGERIEDASAVPHLSHLDPALPRVEPLAPGLFDSFVVLPRASAEAPARLVLALDLGNEFLGEPKFGDFVTVELREGRLTVLSSTRAPGRVIRAKVDHLGRALLATRRSSPAPAGSATVLVTADGLAYQRRELPYAIDRLGASDHPAFPHVLARRALTELLLGDLSDPGQPPLRSLGLETLFEGIRSLAALRTNRGLRVAIGGEDGALQFTELGDTVPALPEWVAIAPRLDQSTAAADCGTNADACGERRLPSELDELHLLNGADGHVWHLLLPKFCAHVVAVRDDACTTHLPLLPVSRGTTDRSLMSLRVSPAGDRALVAGRGGRLFELELQR